MDGGYLFPLPGIRARSVPGILSTAIRFDEDSARGCVDHSFPADPKHLAQLLRAPSSGHLGGIPHLRPLIRIAVPTGATGTASGNQVSAVRWARLLREVGYRTKVQEGWDGKPADGLVALHARKNARAVRAFRATYPDRPLIVVLTGTDVYRDLRTHASARRSLELADLMVVLQPQAVDEVPHTLRHRTHVIYQSAQPLKPVPAARQRSFDVACVGHLRAVKDPMRAAMASRGLPAASRIQVIHAGTALTEALEARAMRETEQNSRYTWLGGLTTGSARRLIAKSRILVVSSRMEGGANVIVEALIDRTPVLASRISGNLGMLGGDYPGYFAFGDTAALTELLRQCEDDPSFLRSLQAHCEERRPRFQEACERDALAKLLGSLF